MQVLCNSIQFKETAKVHYGHFLHLEYNHKIDDFHRNLWVVGDWTDDTDQMILIADVLLDFPSKRTAEIPSNPSKLIQCNEMAIKFAYLLQNWSKFGFKELGDVYCVDIGRSTSLIVNQPDFLSDPHEASKRVWTQSGCQVAANGGVMRTSVVSLFGFGDLNQIIENSLQFCLVTHHDYRCRASCVAVNVAIALMLQGDPKYLIDGELNVDAICNEALARGLEQIPEDYSKQRDDYNMHMTVKSLEDLHLDDEMSIGYTLKCSGCGFWAVKQSDFRKAIESITMAGGDADTNCAVAGAMLGCRLGYSAIPSTWLEGLKYKSWLDERLDRIIQVSKTISPNFFQDL